METKCVHGSQHVQDFPKPAAAFFLWRVSILSGLANPVFSSYFFSRACHNYLNKMSIFLFHCKDRILLIHRENLHYNHPKHKADQNNLKNISICTKSKAFNNFLYTFSHPKDWLVMPVMLEFNKFLDAI